MAKEELELRKLDSEIEQLALLKRKLSKELEEKKSSFWQMPGAWEIVKSLGIFLPLLFASLGYCRSLEQDRQTQLKEATQAFLANSLGAGPHLLEVYVDKHCGEHDNRGDEGNECRQNVARILVLGVRIRDEDIQRARSEGAIRTLKALKPNDQVVEQLCRRVAEDVVFIHEKYVQPADEHRDIKNAEDTKIVNEVNSALRRLKPAVCAAIEPGLCPEARLKLLALDAWKDFQSYLRKDRKLACST